MRGLARRVVRKYAAHVPISRRPPQRVEPVARDKSLGAFAGMWVAVIDGQVVAAEKTSQALAYRLHNMDHRKRKRAVMEYVRPNSDAYIVGVG